MTTRQIETEHNRIAREEFGADSDSYASQWLDAAYNAELDGDERLAKADDETVCGEFREWMAQDFERVE